MNATTKELLCILEQYINLDLYPELVSELSDFMDKVLALPSKEKITLELMKAYIAKYGLTITDLDVMKRAVSNGVRQYYDLIESELDVELNV